jgi:hypothetical protein
MSLHLVHAHVFLPLPAFSIIITEFMKPDQLTLHTEQLEYRFPIRLVAWQRLNTLLLPPSEVTTAQNMNHSSLQ